MEYLSPQKGPMHFICKVAWKIRQRPIQSTEFIYIVNAKKQQAARHARVALAQWAYWSICLSAVSSHRAQLVLRRHFCLSCDWIRLSGKGFFPNCVPCSEIVGNYDKTSRVCKCLHVSIVFIFALFHTLHIISICCCRSTTISSLKFVSTSPTNISNMKLRNLSPIASMMLLTMVPYLFNAASMVTVMASDDHRAPFIKGGQQQLQQSDEMWEAQFYAENRALVSGLYLYMYFAQHTLFHATI